MKTNHFYVVHSFMIQDLKLKPNEALIYAIIYGFSKDRQSSFSGSLRYLTKNTNLSRRTVINILQDLVKKKYIIKKDVFDGNTKYCKYSANFDILDSAESTSPQCKNHFISVQNLPHTSEKITPNNIDN
ncbi:MAG: helix-turn-helix domain-containing protein, partial [Ruminococcus sp.]|nr:helix-turn-helix domain-containing protein [Ruminococcus sp.]